MSNRASRASRGASFAAIATVLAATAHTLGGGAAPSPLYCAILFALAAPLTTALAAARPSGWRTGLAVGASQALFHTAFALTGGVGAAAGSTGGHVHAHGAATTWATDAAIPAPAGIAPVDVDMTVAHVLAAIVTIALVCRGEAAIAAIAAWLVRAAAVPLPAPVLPRIPRSVASTPTPPRAAIAVPPGLGRRGPPDPLSSLVAA